MKIFYTILFCILIVTSCQKQKKYTIYLAGDSTCAQKKPDRYPETGWGMEFQSFFKDNVTIANHAKNGRSTRSFVTEGRWDSIMNLVQPDDYVFIEFGHNDQKPDSARHSTPEEYYDHLCSFVDDVRSHNANAVILTPIVRRHFDENGEFEPSHGVYPAEAIKAAKDKGVPLLDMTKATRELVVKLGDKESKKLWMVADSGVWKNYPDGRCDNTHLNVEGAKTVAGLVVKEIKDADLEIAKDLK